MDCDGDAGWGRRGESDSAEGTGVQKRKQGAGCGTYLAQYGRPVLLQDGVKERYPENRNINSEPSGALHSERDFLEAVSGRYGGL